MSVLPYCNVIGRISIILTSNIIIGTYSNILAPINIVTKTNCCTILRTVVIGSCIINIIIAANSRMILADNTVGVTNCSTVIRIERRIITRRPNSVAITNCCTIITVINVIRRT